MWITCDTAVDFRARLRFPRAAEELLVASAFPAGVFVLPSNQPLEETKHVKPMFVLSLKKSERI